MAFEEETLENDKRDIKEQLASIYLYDRDNDCPTYAGIILFGKNPKYFLLGDYVQFIRFAELPSVWHISLGADVALISIIKVNETVFFLLYEFLQLLGLVRIELRRWFPLWTLPYTSISRARLSKY